MRINLKLMQPLAGLVGSKDLWLDVGGGTLADLIGQLCQDHGAAVAGELLDKEGSLDLAYAIAVDGMVTRSLSTGLRDGSEVLIFASIVGGAKIS